MWAFVSLSAQWTMISCADQRSGPGFHWTASRGTLASAAASRAGPRAYRSIMVTRSAALRGMLWSPEKQVPQHETRAGETPCDEHRLQHGVGRTGRAEVDTASLGDAREHDAEEPPVHEHDEQDDDPYYEPAAQRVAHQRPCSGDPHAGAAQTSREAHGGFVDEVARHHHPGEAAERDAEHRAVRHHALPVHRSPRRGAPRKVGPPPT